MANRFGLFGGYMVSKKKKPKKIFIDDFIEPIRHQLYVVHMRRNVIQLR